MRALKTSQLTITEEKRLDINFEMIRCPFCEKQKTKIIELSHDDHRVAKCENCDIAFVYPFPAPERLCGHYDFEYYSDWLDVQKKSASGCGIGV